MRHALATGAPNYWRRRSRSDTGDRLADIAIETGDSLACGVVAPMVIIWPIGVRVALGVGAVSAGVLGAMHGTFDLCGRGGDACLR
jgi:hypothetical protein